MLLHLSLGLALVGLGQSEDEPSVEQELEALIAKTNALESFHLVYDFEQPETDVSAPGAMIEVIYRAPDLGHVRFPDADVWLVDGTMYFQVEGVWRRATYPQPSAAAQALRELFPSDEPALGPGVFLSLSGGAGHDLQVSFGWAASSRSTVLGWLSAMQRRAELTRDGSSFRWDSGENSYRVSRQTGVLERAEIGPLSRRVILQLRAAHFDIDLDPALVTLPEAARNAEPDPGRTRGLEALFPPGLLRTRAFLHVERLLAASQRPWDERARADWTSFLRLFYRDALQADCTERLGQLTKAVDGLATWCRSEMKGNDSPERRARMEAAVVKERGKLVERLDGDRVAFIETLQPPPTDEVEPRQELFDLELQVIEAVWDELLARPVLALFDEQLGAALGD